MFEWNDPNTLMLIILVFAALAFLARVILLPSAPTVVDEIEDFLWSSQELSKHHVRLSTSATYTAFATVIFWFLALGYDYGYWLFIIPTSLVIGNIIFVRFVQHIDFDFSKYRTIGDLINRSSESKLLGTTSDIIVIIFLFSALLVEVVIGSGLINTLIGGVPGGQLTILLLLSTLVLLYVLLGGYRAIVRTDVLQITATCVGTLAILVFASLYEPAINNTKSQLEYIFLPADRFNHWAIIALFVSAISVHVFGPVCQLTNWQRIKAAKIRSDGIQGHMQGIWITATLWVLLIIIALLLRSIFQTTNPLNEVLIVMRGADLVVQWFLYPLTGIGLVLALVSTADSIMGALFLSGYDITKRANSAFRPKMFHKLIFALIIFTFIVIFYVLNQTEISKNIITVVYFLFAQLVVIFPMVIFVLVDITRRQQAINGIIESKAYDKGTIFRLFLGTISGWIVVCSLTIVGHWTGIVEFIFIASGCGVLFSSLIIVGLKWPQVFKFAIDARLFVFRQ